MENENQPQLGESTREVRIDKPVYGGEGLARTEEGVLLVPLVLPGEQVRIHPGERHKGVRRGSVVDVMEPSPDRVTAACPYFSRCGGCHYQHIRYERQLDIKREILIECFERIGKFRLEAPVIVLASDPWGYRNRTRLQIKKDSAGFEIGYFEPQSHRICSVESCPISSPVINGVIARLASGLGLDIFPVGTADLELFASESGDSMLATVSSAEAAPQDFGDAMRAATPNLESVCWKKERAALHRDKLTEKRTLWGSGALVYHVGDYHYQVGHDSFFQTNRFLISSLIDAVTGGLEGKRALDLYAGVGLFTLPLARRFQEVTAVESGRASMLDLQSNCGVFGYRATILRSEVETFLATASPGWDAIVADPPRSGLGRKVVEHLCRLRARRLVYVSCDPTTLARDLALLIRSGYRLRSVQLLDQFPQTFHMESVAHLESAE